ncbi:hypothetical protein NP493_3862g00000 [Ridgeia piscesae]|uniref:Protein tyrosine phosphatase n=1 Tax=Ridgeia piscesae TaxID=27915 RepID=A0AAD9J444_RIDPI|nr:hypothetical protein NP493_3862g00000 [Ridgeia piscesae]
MSGGVGRTGTFIALDSLLDMGQAEGKVDIFTFACHLRTERMDMVETYASIVHLDQYVFLHHALLDGFQTGHLAYPVSQYPDVYRRLCLDDEHMTELKTQFQRTYWPGEEVSMKSYGKLTVTRLSEPTSTMEDVVERDFCVCITTKVSCFSSVRTFSNKS